MIAVLKPDTSEEQKDNLIEWLKAQNVDVHISKGKEYTVLGLVGNTEAIDVELLESLSIVNAVKRVSEPFKKSNRKFHPENTLINVGDACFGDGSCVVIAGPCSVESEEQLISLAKAVKAAGAKVLRADPFRKYFSPYENVAKLTDNIKLLSIAKKETGLPTASEIVNPDHIERYEDV
ncbi:MAG: 3-deoxy-7-phosphoheptulonate synthase, partial [Eubacteriales bacterium]|nr:3-deoxy-7-phosphoheptulonate synthase [Eubacteriales bacterium]